MIKIVDRLQRCTSISNHFIRYHCAFPSSVFRKTLNPNTPQNVAPLIPHSKISSSPNSSSGSSESYPVQENSFSIDSRSGFFSNFCFGLCSFRKTQSLSSSSSGSVSDLYSDPYLPIRSRITTESPHGLSSTRCKFSSGHRKIGSLMHSFSHPSSPLAFRKANSYCIRRCFTVSSSDGTIISGSEADICSNEQKLENTNTYPPDFVCEVVDILRNCEDDLEARLNMVSSRLSSADSIRNTFDVLNTRRIYGWRFFEWVRSTNPQLRRNANICSLIIDNFGRLDDYEGMFVLLKMFTAEKISLTYEAFRFLPIMAPTTLNRATQRVVNLLNRVGGSCRNSGFHALVEMFCKSNSFEMARYVIKITESKKSYYSILIREKCKNGLIEEAHSIIFEMQENHCAPNTAVYNYLLGSLWRNGKSDEAFALIVEMREFGITPDEITFEILVNFVCSLGKMDDAHKLLDRMASQGLEPRPTTHARVIKALFAAKKYEMAHKFVAGSSCKTSGNMMYSLMANLYREKGDILSAREVLVEMMEKCLKPNFGVYVKIVKGLKRSGKGYLVRDLESRHRKFMVNSRA